MLVLGANFRFSIRFCNWTQWSVVGDSEGAMQTSVFKCSSGRRGSQRDGAKEGILSSKNLGAQSKIRRQFSRAVRDGDYYFDNHKL